jgi:DNA mismatch repair protein MutS2
MQETSAPVLEFEDLRHLIGRFIGSAAGRGELEAVQPSSHRGSLDNALADVAEAIDYYRASLSPQAAGRGAAIRPRFTDLPDVATSVSKLRIEGAALEGRELFELSSFLDRASEIRALLMNAMERFPRLGGMGSVMADLRDVLRGLSGKILPDGSLADDASVALNKLRRDIERQQKQIQDSLERFLRAHRDDGTLQDDYITIRNERFVVPVVSGQRRKVDGVIHGASGTGQTLFVEPLATIELNNELIRLHDEELREVARILRELTDRLRAHAGEIAATAREMGHLDLLFAKAAFANDFDCTVPRISAESQPRILLREARHPLLEDILRRTHRKVVPVTLELDNMHRTLLISGPNTGGKTVSLKTVGLLALMAHAAFPVPAAEAEFPLFDRVLADIGDHQSLEESLSSFSAHILSVKGMLESATGHSLVLLDELGRATDPEEGGALGVAILERFRSTSAFTLASTHLLAMKVYGANTQGVVNASMGFDDETLRPTYQLRTGAPGKSAALDIAVRLGMPGPLIDRARSLMTNTEQDLQRFLSELHRRLESVEQLEAESRAKLERVEARERNLERDWEKKYTARIREFERKAEEMQRRFEDQARQTIEQISQNLEQRKASEKALRRVAQTRREFTESVEQAIAADAPASAQVKPAIKLTEGVRVRLKGIRQPALVKKVHGDGAVDVEAGILKMRVSVGDVEEVLAPGDSAAKLPQNITFRQDGPKWDVSYREINVIGKRAEEAMEEVDRFLDHAALAEVDRIRIVHGHGMGVLKRAVAELLKKSPHVEKFYPATPSEGGEGATIVELKA